MGFFRWPIGRVSRSTLFFWLLLSAVGFNLIDWFAFHTLDLTINFGFRTRAIAMPDSFPLWRTALEVAFDAALAIVAIARLHDADRPAWWLAAIASLAIVSLIPGAGFLGLVALVGWVAIFFLPPSIGPNRFGPDPRGWVSREQFEQQERELAAQRKR